jgi:hypothetical protein
MGYTYVNLGKLPFDQVVDEWFPIYTIKKSFLKRAQPELRLSVCKSVIPESPGRSSTVTPRHALATAAYEYGGRIQAAEYGGRIQAARGTAVVQNTGAGRMDTMASSTLFPTYDSFAHAVVDAPPPPKVDNFPPPFAPAPANPAPATPDVTYGAATVLYPPPSPGNGVSKYTLVKQPDNNRQQAPRPPPRNEHNTPIVLYGQLPPTPSSPDLQVPYQLPSSPDLQLLVPYQHKASSPAGQAQIPTHVVAAATTHKLLGETSTAVHQPKALPMTTTSTDSNNHVACNLPCSLVYVSTDRSDRSVP